MQDEWPEHYAKSSVCEESSVARIIASGYRWPGFFSQGVPLTSEGREVDFFEVEGYTWRGLIFLSGRNRSHAIQPQGKKRTTAMVTHRAERPLALASSIADPIRRIRTVTTTMIIIKEAMTSIFYILQMARVLSHYNKGDALE